MFLVPVTNKKVVKVDDLESSWVARKFRNVSVWLEAFIALIFLLVLKKVPFDVAIGIPTHIRVVEVLYLHEEEILF